MNDTFAASLWPLPSFTSRLAGRRFAAIIAASFLGLLASGLVSAHEERDVAGYSFEVGLIDEPVYVGDKSGLEFFVHKGDAPVEGLEKTLKAEVIYRSQRRDLPVEAREDDPGAYRSEFIPTAAGPYTFHLSGTVEGEAVDESFTSSLTGFNEVQEVSAGQFPVQFPAQAELVADAQAGKDASGRVTLAIALGAAGLAIGLVGVGLALAGRRRPV
jgi:hypothetical protein